MPNISGHVCFPTYVADVESTESGRAEYRIGDVQGGWGAGWVTHYGDPIGKRLPLIEHAGFMYGS